jgi:hypothetical protein
MYNIECGPITGMNVGGEYFYDEELNITFFIIDLFILRIVISKEH